jgi:hypothetical protein
MVDVSYGLRALLDAVENALCHKTETEAKA